MRVIDISEYEDELVELERLHYDTNARQNVIAMIIANNQYNSEAYEKYCREYTDCFMKYSKLKDEFSKKFITEDDIKNDRLWEINFNTKEFVIK